MSGEEKGMMTRPRKYLDWRWIWVVFGQ